MGGSYGGYATLAGLTFTPSTFACGVDIVGPSNLETLLKTIPPYWTGLLAQFHHRMGARCQIAIPVAHVPTRKWERRLPVESGKTAKTKGEPS